MSPPEHHEHARAQEKGRYPAERGAELAEGGGRVQRDNEEGERECEGGVGEGFDPGHLKSAEPKPGGVSLEPIEHAPSPCRK